MSPRRITTNDVLTMLCDTSVVAIEFETGIVCLSRPQKKGPPQQQELEGLKPKRIRNREPESYPTSLEGLGPEEVWFTRTADSRLKFRSVVEAISKREGRPTHQRTICREVGILPGSIAGYTSTLEKRGYLSRVKPGTFIVTALGTEALRFPHT